MNQPQCVQLTITDSPFIESFDPLGLPKTRHTIISHLECISTDVMDIFEQLDLEISFVEVFYSKPYLNSNIHVDGAGGDYTKVNWIFGGINSSMNWYMKKSQTDTVKPRFPRIVTPIGTNTVTYNSNEVDPIHSERIIRPSLVQVGIPHNIINGEQDRWCISVNYRDKITGKRPTMEESRSLFKKFIT